MITKLSRRRVRRQGGAPGKEVTGQNRFLDSTLKTVRGRITDFYKNRIDFLFTPETKGIVNRQNLNIVGRFE